jgi:hypothetical protein
VLGVELLLRLGRGPDVPRHGQHLLEPLALVQALGEAEARAGDARERLGPADQVLAGGREPVCHGRDPIARH